MTKEITLRVTNLPFLHALTHGHDASREVSYVPVWKEEVQIELVPLGQEYVRIVPPFLFRGQLVPIHRIPID